MTNIIDFLLNILLISILEESYVVVATLILLRMTNMIVFNKKLVTSILVPAVISNILRYFFNIDMTIIFIVFILTMVVIICLLYKQKTLKRIFAVFSFVSVACMINAMLEIVNFKVIMLCTSINEFNLKDNIINAFVSSLPIRVVELGIIVLYLRKRKYFDEKINTNIWKTLIKDEELALFSLIASVFNIIWIVAAVKIFVLDKFLINSSLETQTTLLILMGVIVVPIIIYICLFFSVYNIQAREAYIERLNTDLIKARENLAKNEIHRDNYKGNY
ncbi:hypothetical protein EHE19_011920 [Ruminiclostridium herbifermentans]|uniref:Uncharacterized protein n=1 Tax=Ruminiclostridium herbifermentans TaxID=2488810 RepID=A0A4U7JAK4_9FIRM|nr:hypothetical protein [Ruminiclostridium herbifermentans]QNU65628.1 hypothetical protein EHE19_011920 [Ruminiclostridium herbifermentans]